jgi:hypothetical protein
VNKILRIHKTTKKAYRKKGKQSCLWIVQETKPCGKKKVPLESYQTTEQEISFHKRSFSTTRKMTNEPQE